MLGFGAKSCMFRLLQTISQAAKVAMPTPPGARAVLGSALGKAGLVYLLDGLIFFKVFSLLIK